MRYAERHLPSDRPVEDRAGDGFSGTWLSQDSARSEGPDGLATASEASRTVVPLPVLPEDDVGPQPDGPALRAGGRHFALLLMAGALISKTLGFVRELVMAHTLGASLAADGFRGAVTAVLLPLAVLSNESVPAVIVPMCRDWHRTGEAATRLTALAIALTGAAVVLMLGVEALGTLWVDAIVGGYTPAGRALTLDFVRVMALGMPATVLQNCLAAGEIAVGRSRLTTIRASTLNVAVLVGLAAMLVTGYVGALAWSFAIAFNGLAACGLWWLWRERLLDTAGARPALVISAAAEFLRRLYPLLPIPAFEQGNVWVERVLASRFTTGTVASIDYARTLTDTALLLISQPVGLAILARDPASDTRRQVAFIARPTLAVMLPGCVFVVAFAPDIARLVFGRGAFDATAVMLTSQALRGIAAGLWASTLGLILMRILNSTGRNGATAVALIAAHATNIGLNLATCAWAGDGGEGSLALGFGEAVRGLVLLGGTTLLLGCWREVATAFLLAAPSAVLMALATWQIPMAVADPLPRLIVGATACTACCLLGLLLALPDLHKRLGRALGFSTTATSELAVRNDV